MAYGFGSMIEKLKKSPKTIVFTEGTDPRILEASSRLLASTFLTPILIGKPDEVMAAAEKAGARLVHPTKILCTDNAVMIACRGYYMYRAGVASPLNLNAVPALKLG